MSTKESEPLNNGTPPLIETPIQFTLELAKEYEKSFQGHEEGILKAMDFLLEMKDQLAQFTEEISALRRAVARLQVLTGGDQPTCKKCGRIASANGKCRFCR
jgi:hypothetical protein